MEAVAFPVFACSLHVFVDGRYEPHLSALGATSEVHVESLAELAAASPERLEPYLGRLVDAKQHPFAALATGLFDGRHSPREIGGPIVIAQISGAASRAGIGTLIFFTALLSINLAVMNLLPIPALDGGHLALLAFEKIRGRPAGERINAALGRLGFATVLIITLWAVTADMLRLFGV